MVINLLREMGQRIAARGRRATLYVVGGAAMVVSYGRKTSTADIDAVSREWDLIEQVAAEMASDMSLPPNWLSSNAGGYIPGEHDAPYAQLIYGGLTVQVASPRDMLAMKLRAFRAKDFDDISLLVKHLQLRDTDAIVDVVLNRFDDDSVPPSSREETQLVASRALRIAWGEASP
ncbi:MAG TPA: hypothetical protein DIW46_06455 [Microbacterium sp.]|nr:hypothetical protein [Microbacterium sp.]